MKITVFSKISGTPCLGLDSFTFVTLSCKTEWKQCFCRFMCSFFFCHVFSNNRIGLIRTVVFQQKKAEWRAFDATCCGDVTEQQIRVLLFRPKFLVSSELTIPSQHFLWFSYFLLFTILSVNWCGFDEDSQESHCGLPLPFLSPIHPMKLCWAVFQTHYAHDVLFHHGAHTRHLAESCENKGS